MKYYDQTEVEQVYFHIGEVAKILDLAPSKIRFWLIEFDIDKEIRRRHGNRIFTANNINKLTEIRRLLVQDGFTIWGAKKQLGKTCGKC